jgi:hypothetical protein
VPASAHDDADTICGLRQVDYVGNGEGQERRWRGGRVVSRSEDGACWLVCHS